MIPLRCTKDDCQKLDRWLVKFSDKRIELTCSACATSVALPVMPALGWPETLPEEPEDALN